MPSVHVPVDHFRVHLGMELHGAEHGEMLSSDATGLADDPDFKQSFREVMDELLGDATMLSYPLLTRQMELPFDSTGHVSSDVMMAQLTKLLNQSKLSTTDSFDVSKLDGSICIRWNGGWLVIDDYSPTVNGAPWTLTKVVDHYIAAKSVANPNFAELNKAALSELRAVRVQLCVQYSHETTSYETAVAHHGGSPSA